MTDKYAVVGNPVAHSKSPQIHRMFARQTGQDISYEAVLAPLHGFSAKIDELRKKGYKGCNVTVPFKFEAYSYVGGRLTDRAIAAKAVNTLKFEDGTAIGDNTDGAGLVTDITRNSNFSLTHKRVLLVGAGGAAWGVVWPLFLEEPNKTTFANRTEEKAQDMYRFYFDYYASSCERSPELSRNSEPFIACSYNELRDQQFDVVINATSSGLSDEMPDLPETIFAAGSLAYDMMYGRDTPFMKFAREHGAAVVSDGLGMLVEQAAESFYIWRGERPETAPVIAALRSS